MLRWYEPAHVVGISKTTYVLATPRFPDWRHDLQQTSTHSSLPSPIDPPRCPCRRRRGAYRCPRLPVIGGLVFVGNVTHLRGAARAPPAGQSARRPPRCT